MASGHPRSSLYQIQPERATTGRLVRRRHVLASSGAVAGHADAILNIYKPVSTFHLRGPSETVVISVAEMTANPSKLDCIRTKIGRIMCARLTNCILLQVDGGGCYSPVARTWFADHAANSTSSGAESTVECLSGCELALER
ncbi:hypothetical protein CBL_01243 [Carabus blaptoides fortunei]